mgnify:CR=1 FL=1
MKAMGVPEKYLKQKYLPNIDWDEVAKYSAEDVLERETGESQSDQDNLGGMGMY